MKYALLFASICLFCASLQAQTYQELRGSSIAFRQTATKTVTNTVTETTLVGTGIGSMTIPANYVKTGSSLRLSMRGLYSDALLPGNMVVKVKLGSTVIATGTITNLLGSASNLSWYASINVSFRTVGSSGTVICDGSLNYSTGPLASKNSVDLNNAGSTTTVNTTTAQLLDVTITYATQSTSNIASSDFTTLEIFY